VLADASRARQSTVIRGGGTKIGWGRVPVAVDLVVDTTRLDRLVAHRHEDMTATVQAGVGLAALNRRLAEHDQRLPVESAFEGTTVGGLLATNDAGPLRHRYGTPRDLLIGVTLALADGRIVKAGGTVVKNVAGYDLGKLVCGSHGTLAAIVDATFKLLPVPRASATLVASYADTDELARDAAALAGSQVELMAFDLRMSERTGLQLLVRLASSPVATAALTREAKQVLSAQTLVVTSGAEQDLWAEQIRLPWAGQAAVVRLSWRPSDLPQVVSLVRRLTRAGCGPITLVGRIAGAGLLRFQGDARAVAASIADLRASALVGHVVLLRGSRELKDLVDVWGPDPGGAAAAARALKRMFDPSGILGAGRGVI